MYADPETLTNALPSEPVPATSPLYVPLALAEFRVAFLTASTWAQSTASESELEYALLHWVPGQSIADAMSALQIRRALERRGLLRKQEREAREAADNDF